MADEDDKWLYGDCNQEDEQEKDGSATLNTTPEVTKNVGLQPPEIRTEEEKNEKEKEEIKDSAQEEEAQDSSENKEKKENGELDDDKGEDEEDDEDDDDSDEDNVNVIIGDINKSGPTYTNINIPKRGPNISGPGVKSAGKFSMEDFESVGIINGVPAHEFNVDIIEDKPWRMPGADITDYFNYGFNEETWKAYCERQKRIRIHESCTGLPTQTLANQSWTSSQSSQSTQYANAQAAGGKKAGWETGQIRVIGAGVASRRIDESGSDNQNIQVLPPNSNFSGIPPPSMMPPMIPPMEMPPPGFSSSGDHYGGPPSSNEYFNPEPDYFPSYEPTAADQWRDNWTPGNLVTFGQSVKPVHSHLEDNNSQDRKDKEKDRERDRSSDRDRERNVDRDDKDKRKDRSHRNRSRSKSHERKRKSRSRSRSRSRSPSHKKHKKKSKKSDKKKRSDDESNTSYRTSSNPFEAQPLRSPIKCLTPLKAMFRSYAVQKVITRAIASPMQASHQILGSQYKHGERYN